MMIVSIYGLAAAVIPVRWPVPRDLVSSPISKRRLASLARGMMTSRLKTA
jgi:hypothetical protein